MKIMEYAVETFSLTKVFSDWWGRDKIYAVNELNLKVKYNEIFGLLGPNGSGKTTTLKMLLNLLYPTKGRSVVLGGDTRDPKISDRIGFLPEESYLYRYLNARETLDFYGRLFGLDRRIRKMRIEALLDMVGLKAAASRPIGTFSKGMARRIGLAQALINDPDLLILDEPTTGLDPIGTRQIKDLILELAKRGKTVLLSSHLLADVEDVCDRIAILYGGGIQTEGRVRELLTQTGKKQINTGLLSRQAINRIKQVVQSESSVCEIVSPLDKLERFFVKTVLDAEKQQQPTSGALGTGHIENFLKTEAPAESVLDKLVSHSGKKAEQVPFTKQPREKTKDTAGHPKAPAKQEQSPSETDEQLLEHLTKKSKPAPTKPVEHDDQEQTRPPEQKQHDKDVLDDLTGRTDSSNDNHEQSDDNDRENEDA